MYVKNESSLSGVMTVGSTFKKKTKISNETGAYILFLFNSFPHKRINSAFD